MMMSEDNRQKYGEGRLAVDKVHQNLAQEVVEITVDKLKILLTSHVENLRKASEWQAAAALLAGVIATLSTATFKEVFGISAAAWQAVFVVIGVLSFFWLLKSLVRLYRSGSVDSLIECIKNTRNE
jgi:Na+/melibiose symporter-like transporter